MIIIDHFILNDKIEIEVKIGYEKNFSTFKLNCHDLISLGFFKNKFRNTWRKTYYAKEYIQDRFDSDIKTLKSLSSHFRMRSFKMMNSEQNFKDHLGN